MSATPETLHYTIPDLYRPEFDGKRVELWEGEILEMPPASVPHNLIAMRLNNLLHSLRDHDDSLHALPHGSGVRIADDTMLIPDAGLIRIDPSVNEAIFNHAPEIAVEIVSPSNKPAELIRKRSLYFQGGSEQVWMLHPEGCMAEVFLRDGTVRLFDNCPIVGEGIASGLVIDLKELFRPLVPTHR